MAAYFRTGNYDTARYTPESAVTAGDIIESGTGCMIAHHDIAANVEGAVAIGGGVYEIPATSGDTIAQLDPVYWSGTVAEEESSGGVFLGWAAEAKASGETTIMVLHGQISP